MGKDDKLRQERDKVLAHARGLAELLREGISFSDDPRAWQSRGDDWQEEAEQALDDFDVADGHDGARASGLEKLIEGLTVFVKYDTERRQRPTYCEHDILMVCAAATKDVSEEDARRLKELKFFWSDEHECWCSYRFGSC